MTKKLSYHSSDESLPITDYSKHMYDASYYYHFSPAFAGSTEYHQRTDVATRSMINRTTQDM